jgi:glycine/D-amino acid oxidase-like deaminating enzyme
MDETADFAVIGGGVVGASIAYGLALSGCSVVLLDGSASDPRASAANFGLVWVQGKGPGSPDYQRLTRVSSDLWPAFAEELTEIAGPEEGVPGSVLPYERNGGLTFTFGEDGYTERESQLHRLHNERGGENDHEMIDRAAIQRLMPEFELGPEVTGASFCWRDGCVNPLKLHSALLRAIPRLGGRVLFGSKVDTIRPVSLGWELTTATGRIGVGHVVVAAGLATQELAESVGLDVPVRPQRGQVIVSQRLPRVMTLPASTLRQTADGTFLVGATKEDVGLDRSTTLDAAGQLARNALRITPALRDINVVRHWAGLRVMTPDGAPIYQFSDRASAAACHSGITLAPVHARLFSGRITGGDADALMAFHPARFGQTA